MTQKVKRKEKEKKFTLFTKGSNDYIILIVVMLMLALGLIMVLSASSPASLSETGDSYQYFKKQALCAAIGLIAMFFISKIDYRIYKKFAWIIYIGFIVLLVLVGLFGVEAGGARRWIIIAGINFQPSELAKIGFIIFFASLLTDIKKKGNQKKFIKGFCWPIVLLGPIVVSILILQNHFSATFLICMITLIQIFVAGITLRNFLIAAGLGGGFLSIYVIANGGLSFFSNFRSDRIETWKDPFADPTGDGWQIIQSFYTIASGGMFGVGLGESKQKYLYLPEPHNDFIFSVLAEELGFFGCVVVILLFAIFIWRGIVIAMRAQDMFGCLIAVGIVALIGLQAMINIAVVTGTIPVTGMPLPFFSYGGTAIIANLAAVGILLNISRSGVKK